MRRLIAWTMFCILLLARIAVAQETKRYSADQAPEGWEITGVVQPDARQPGHSGLGSSLKVTPGSRAFWKLRDTDGSGKVEMWIFDDLTHPSQAKSRHVGPRWGLLQSDGHILVMGILYAPYLAGDASYTSSDSDGKQWLNSVQYSALKRTKGWHKWTFDFNPLTGLSILLEDKKSRFDWNLTKLRGFCGIVLLGDEAGDAAQTFWVDDLAVTLGSPATTQPVAPPPPPSVTPDKDPAPEHPVQLLAAVRGQHPRLMFTAQDVPRLQALAAGEGKPFYDQLLKYLPSCNAPTDAKYITDATDAQRQGFWRLPTVALHYVLTGDRDSLQRSSAFLQAFLKQEHWEVGDEPDCGMCDANIMVGVALAFDWLYHDLDPSLRDAVAKRLLQQARLMYYGGHLMKADRVHYWQQEPQNNHRWHHDAGLTLAALAIADEPQLDAGWIIEQTRKELEYVRQWLPEDGSDHESPTYLVFGAPYIVIAFDAADRCLGTDLLGHPFFKNTPAFRLNLLTPGLGNSFGYADSDGVGYINSYSFRCASRFHDADLQAALLAFYQANPNSFMYGWFSLLWFDPTLKGGSMQRLPLNQFYPDLGLAAMRDGWAAENVALIFKCSPPGGQKLNEFRNIGDYRYINVAHDDPDANMFQIYARGGFVADNDHYAGGRGMRLSSSHNTILVNGKGQKTECKGWLQPLSGKTDMTKLAWITAWQQDAKFAVVEGEAGPSYTDLKRYRRTVVWVNGCYVLILDDIIANKPSDISWLVESVDVKTTNTAGQYLLGKNSVATDLLVASDGMFTAEIGTSTALAHEETSLNLKQLQLKSHAARWRVASVFDLWKRGARVSVSPADEGQKVSVETSGGHDVWNWQPPADDKSPSRLTGQRADGSAFTLK